MHLTLTPQKLPDATGYNVIADLKGSEHPEQIVVVSGHLDSWDLGTGAIDDAAGVAVAMETAEILQKLHLRPKRTLRVIAWMDEENGGSGSQAYTKDHSANFPNHVAAIESDTGAAHPLGFDVEDERARRRTPTSRARMFCRVSEPTLCTPSSLPAGSRHCSACRKPACPHSASCRMAAPTSTTITPPPTRWTKLFPAELRENAAAMAVMGYALASMKNPLPR